MVYESAYERIENLQKEIDRLESGKEEQKTLWETIVRILTGFKNIIKYSIKIRKMKKELKRRGIDWKG